jgi:hypothetical protein
MPIYMNYGDVKGEVTTLQLSGGLLKFSFNQLPPLQPEVRGFAVTPVEPRVWTEADVQRFTAKVQAFYDSLTEDEQVAMEALLRQGGEHGPL